MSWPQPSFAQATIWNSQLSSCCLISSKLQGSYYLHPFRLLTHDIGTFSIILFRGIFLKGFLFKKSLLHTRHCCELSLRQSKHFRQITMQHLSQLIGSCAIVMQKIQVISSSIWLPNPEGDTFPGSSDSDHISRPKGSGCLSIDYASRSSQDRCGCGGYGLPLFCEFSLPFNFHAGIRRSMQMNSCPTRKTMIFFLFSFTLPCLSHEYFWVWWG